MSLAVETRPDLQEDGAIPRDLPLEAIAAGPGIRSGNLDDDHVALLMETADQWPPIVVWGDECLVVDGAHRLEAARRLGRTTVAAVRFLGTQDEAFVESVRRNVDHGLPLTLGDRRRAAHRVLAGHPEWSDRRIGSLCGLSGKSVGRLRRRESSGLSGTAGVVVHLQRRIGRDGKTRPVQPGEVRDRIRRALDENPDGSLRAIAAIAGSCPETVRTVRAQLIQDQAAEGRMVSMDAVAQGPGQVRSARSVIRVGTDRSADDQAATSNGRDGHAWAADLALLSCGDRGEFARWFGGNHVDDEWHRYVWTVPMGRVYDIVDEARRRAASWTAFASLLESRTR
jgi:hypothetical protein